MKNSNDTNWDRTSDLPICSTAPWPLCCLWRNILRTINKRKAEWIGHIFRRSCFLEHVTEGNVEGRIEVTARRGRNRKQILDDFWKIEDTVNWKRTHWIALCGGLAFERVCGPIVRQNTKWMSPVHGSQWGSQVYWRCRMAEDEEGCI